MRTRVKFCGLVRPQDVLDAVALGVDAIGFVFYEKSPRCVTPAEAQALRKLLPSWVSAVGLFVNSPATDVSRTASQVGLDVVQLHGDETAELALEIGRLTGKPWWRAARCRAESDLLHCVQHFDQAEAWLLDSFSPLFGGTGESFDWSIVAGFTANQRAKMIMSGGLDAGSVGQAIQQIGSFAVDVSSGIQGTDPRQKDSKKMAAFLAAVAEQDANSRDRYPA